MRSVEQHSKNSRAGFTLLEMAIVTLILGFGIAAFAPIYKLYLQDKATKTTQANIDNITAAIGSFRAINGRYPWPASLTAVSGNPVYGREQPYNCPGVAPGNFDAAAGIHVEQAIAARSLTYTNPCTNTTVTQPPVVLVGFVPFRELNLDESQAYDGYGNRIMYVVTQHLANDVTFRADEGGIEIRNGVGGPARSVVNPSGSAHFLVFSYGPNGSGAYLRNGVRTACPANGTLEHENCDISANAVYALNEVNTSSNANAFDDVLSFFTQSEVPLWQLSSDPAAVPGSIHQKPGGNVGTSYTTTNQVLAAREQVNGDIRATDDPATGATEGKIMAVDLCPNGGAASGQCFQTKLIAGNIAAGTGGMICPTDDTIDDDGDGVVETGTYMVGIRMNKPICENEIVVKCPTGTLMQGIDVNGNIQCSSPPPPKCVDTVVQLCGTNVTIPGAKNGVTRTISAGANATQTFQCQNIANVGTWVSIGTSGSCTCTAGSTVTNPVCGTGFNGNITRTCTTVCPSGAVTCTDDTSACNCIGATQTSVSACAVGFSGNITSTRTFTCTSATTGTWSIWSSVNTCTCNPQTLTQSAPCTAPLTGSKTQTNTFVCPAGTWSGWVDTDTSGCTCTPKVWTQDDPCPAGKVGYIRNQYTLSCPAATTSVTPVDNQCSDPVVAVCSWGSNSSPSPSGSPSGPRLGSSGCTCGQARATCYSGSGSNYQIYSPCTCQ